MAQSFTDRGCGRSFIHSIVFACRSVAPRAAQGLFEDLNEMAALRGKNKDARGPGKVSLIGRLIFEDFYGNYDAD